MSDLEGVLSPGQTSQFFSRPQSRLAFPSVRPDLYSQLDNHLSRPTTYCFGILGFALKLAISSIRVYAIRQK